MPITLVDEITANPDVNQPDKIESELDAFVTQCRARITQQNTQAQEVSDLALRAESAAGELDNSKWSPGMFTEGQVTWSPMDYLTYRAKTTGELTIDPSVDNANWVLLTKTSGGGARRINVSEDLYLQQSDPRIQSITMDVASKFVYLPDPSTLDEGGPLFIITNRGEHPFGMKGANGDLIARIDPGWCLGFSLINKTTAEWLVLNYSNDCYPESAFAGEVTVIDDRTVSSINLITRLTNTRALFLIGVNNVYKATVIDVSADGTMNIGAAFDINVQDMRGVKLIRLNDNACAVIYHDLTTLNSSYGYKLKSFILSINGNDIDLPADPITIASDQSNSSTTFSVISIDAGRLHVCYSTFQGYIKCVTLQFSNQVISVAAVTPHLVASSITKIKQILVSEGKVLIFLINSTGSVSMMINIISDTDPLFYYSTSYIKVSSGVYDINLLSITESRYLILFAFRSGGVSGISYSFLGFDPENTAIIEKSLISSGSYYNKILGENIADGRVVVLTQPRSGAVAINCFVLRKSGFNFKLESELAVFSHFYVYGNNASAWLYDGVFIVIKKNSLSHVEASLLHIPVTNI